MRYPKAWLGPDVRLPPDEPPILAEIDEAVLAYWRTVSPRSVGEPSGAGERAGSDLVLLDGPPFANGLPHFGHLLTGFVKDVVVRYATMRGRRVAHQLGWDCHGLPAEVEAERELGFAHKAEIERLGVRTFNDTCRRLVAHYIEEWHGYLTRQGRAVNVAQSYKTLDLTYMESVIWAFRRLWDEGLIYEGLRVLAYCWRCETPLSNAETRLDNAVKPRTDVAITVRFRLETGDYLLAWTTTAWTLPSNLALAVSPDTEYVRVRKAEDVYLLARGRLARYPELLEEAPHGRLEGTVRGESLVGLKYEPVFDYFADNDGCDTRSAFRVLAADFVDADEGTGAVHLAPAHGEDDQRVCTAAGIPTILAVDDRARFTSLVPEFEGCQVFEASNLVTDALHRRRALVRSETVVHDYPHCWRCDNPLIYKAVESWFVNVTRLKPRMLELNQQVAWVPSSVGSAASAQWLADARDWAISRNRFWGTPIPVWKSDDPAYPRTDVYGSLEEIRRDFGIDLDDLHRPDVDRLVRPNPDDPTLRATMRRVPMVLDCWFESGCMPFAHRHYPFENQEPLRTGAPADYVIEYAGQIRGWFYALHVLATALFDRPAFKTGIVHGVLLGSDGRKMSKSLRNYPDPAGAFADYGADAVRWSLLSSAAMRGGELVVSAAAIQQSVRDLLLPMWRSWHFFLRYANAAKYEATLVSAADHLLDRYLLAVTRALVRDLARCLDVPDLPRACAVIDQYVSSLTNWYIRRSRRRFWQGDRPALNVLYTALTTLTRAAAPLLPFVSEWIYRALTGEESVHASDWPAVDHTVDDETLLETMSFVRAVCSAAHAIRKQTRLRTRQPLSALTVMTHRPELLAGFTQLIADEVNVRTVNVRSLVGSAGTLHRKLVINLAVAGPRLRADTPAAVAAAARGEWKLEADGSATAGGVNLRSHEFEIQTSPEEDLGEAGLGVRLADDSVVILDTQLTRDLELEGVARDVIRAVQRTRREAGFAWGEPVRVGLSDVDSDTAEAVLSHCSLIREETGASRIELNSVPADIERPAVVGGNRRVWITLERSR